MRVTAETKQRTRAAILAAGRRLFRDNGFQGTSTRDLAVEAGIASGTLFNYFPSKDALAAELVARSLARARPRYEARRHGAESLAEDLFAFVAAGLRELEPLRRIVGHVVETAMSPFLADGAPPPAIEIREQHLETVADILDAHGARDALDAVSMHLYWTLYLGVIAFWSGDESPKREDTLHVLDRSMQLLVSSIAPEQQEGAHDGR